MADDELTQQKELLGDLGKSFDEQQQQQQQATPPRARKAASPRRRRKPAKTDGQVVFMLGTSHDAGAGQRRTVTPELAKSLVDRGLARYPKSHPEA